MADYLRLRLRQVVRAVATSVPGRLLAFVAAGVIVAAGIQFLLLGNLADSPVSAGSAVPGRLQAEVGYALLLLVAMSLVTGPQSSRFPCTPADVAWVYASPIPTGRIVMAQMVWQAARRCAFWIAGGLIVDVVGAFALDSRPGLFLVRAVLVTPLLVAQVAVSVGAGSTRGSIVPSRVSVSVGAALGVATLLPLFAKLATGSAAGAAVDGAALSPVARSVGGLMFGQFDLVAAGVLAAMAVVSAALYRAGGAGLREQATLDAAFWADFSATSMRATIAEPRPSFRHLARLTGPWALLWFEVAALRRANYQRGSLLVLLISSVLAGSFAPEFVPLFAYAAPIGVVTGAYLSGLARHLRLRTVLAVPGRTSSRVVAAEAVHAAFAGLGLTVSLVAGGAAGGYSAAEIAGLVVQGLVLLVAAFATRVAAAALSFRDGGLAGVPFHLTLAIVAAVAACAIVTTAWLGSKVGAPTPVAVFGMFAVALALLGAALRLFEDRVGPPNSHDETGPVAIPLARSH